MQPDRQRQGVGLALMDHALQALEANGETVFFVLGHPTYYPRAGFSSAMAAAVDSPWRGNPAFMLRAASAPTGALELPPVIRDAE